MPAYDGFLFTPPAPLALVSIQDPSSGETVNHVPMLLDTGADITVVPESCILSLKIPFDQSSGYEVEGFGGQQSVARSVHLNLILSHLTFRGQFLVADQPYGILGRNLLNHLRISFRGPELVWDFVQA